MNKTVIIVIGIVVIVGAVFALKNFYAPPIEPEPTPATSQTLPPQQLPTSQVTTPTAQVKPTPATTSQLTPPQQLPTSQGTIPPAQVKPTPTPIPTPKPTTVKPPTTSSSVLDRIEAAIRAKLKR